MSASAAETTAAPAPAAVDARMAAPARWVRHAGTASFAVLLIAIIAITGRPTAAAQLVAAVTIAVVLLHSLFALGVLEAAAFAAICLLVTFSIENVGMGIGVPFGTYVFNVGASLPHIGTVPLIVGPMYFGIGYPAWIIANLLLGERVARPCGAVRLVALPVTAAFVIVQWDVVVDPVGSTLEHSWTWLSGGAYFGVPASNYAGWWIETYLFFQLFALLQYARRRGRPPPPRSRAFWAMPVLLYLAAGLCHIPPLFEADAILTDARGRVWSAADLRESVVIVMLFTMVPTALLALFRLTAASRPSVLDATDRSPISGSSMPAEERA